MYILIQTGFSIDDDKVEEEDASQCYQGHSPVDQKHDDNTETRNEQTQPFVVILQIEGNSFNYKCKYFYLFKLIHLKSRTPSNGLDEIDMETRVI